MRKISLMVVMICLLLTQKAASQPFWSVGPKIGYTFGENAGLTGGVEVSYLPQNRSSFTYGYTLDINFWPKHVSVHLGFETWFFLGVDVGPTFFFSKNGVNPGLSIIAWDGLILYPYYELGIPFNGELFQGVGAYLKFPIGYQNDFSFG